uniref:Uncharacterized protein n=1 Tax=virus sp. ctDYl1 TaxID=2826795 RepID=A0A8S5R8X9_9VIRU|nr:MAG TPA: hypothetical protein [virus sp. ctDYl1]DAG98415.1 MAG TPA: hypothetical protein [Herelleviridae sp.]DAM71561.1 MAG TPA: hypothetical protein [Caudoviricetes sp.]DAP10124.1 MAG TPA: hypothetical protein [Caudoviricetes sp.]DAZ57791.1 MAG TPA: hypothetical protein [Caudoviricetes sp.]
MFCRLNALVQSHKQHQMFLETLRHLRSFSSAIE